MAVYVNTNYSALQGQRYFGNVQNSLNNYIPALIQRYYTSQLIFAY